ncbi:N-acetylglucosamine-6-phosphate deacetylase [Prochlorococcus marinus]|uniref:N-acetylglucosamine-6-phosphate deacetylase n=1 Tax=Prochlorococcus marinus TaxID=1219 RepID=UPI0022B50DE9|nr:N-acetylglucosamine-6-phosphate deacetylase [Prochlorococcus marinus]
MRNLINIQIPSSSPNCDVKNLWWISIDDDGKILSIAPMSTASDINVHEDWDGDWISPRGIDLQINGGLGLAFNEIDSNHLPKLIELLDYLWADGVEAICPTLVSCSVSALRNALEVFRLAREQTANNRCKLLGAHLEGPFLSKFYRGAHQTKYICLPSLEELDQRISGFEADISLVTIAPELPGASDVIRKLQNLGILVSLGHSGADSKISSLSFDLGISMLTHTFNAMPGLHHRDPGPIAEALNHGQIALGLIADGFHVHPHLAVILKQLASDQIYLVSDALAPYGLEEKQFIWDKRLLNIEKGICRLENGTLAGTTISLLEGCKRLAKWTGDPSAAIWYATVSPRLVLQKNKQIKDCFIGKPLETLLRWHSDKQSSLLKWTPA